VFDLVLHYMIKQVGEQIARELEALDEMCSLSVSEPPPPLGPGTMYLLFPLSEGLPAFICNSTN